jgi:hypothetical protein
MRRIRGQDEAKSKFSHSVGIHSGMLVTRIPISSAPGDRCCCIHSVSGTSPGGGFLHDLRRNLG